MTWSLWPLGFLVAAVIDDLCFKKFHNWLFLSLIGAGVLFVVLQNEITVTQALGGFVVGGLLMLPLVLMGAIGAGDMKFMMCFGIIMGTLPIFEIFVYALFWGAAIGVLQSALGGSLSELINNIKGMAYKLKPAKPHKIPYTVAIFMGWVSYIQFGGLL